MDHSTIETTRRGLHGVAELLLAGPQYRASHTIRLLVSPGGFRTFAEPVLRVEGDALLVGGRRLRLSGTTCAALAREIGVEPGAPEGLYADGSAVDTGEVLDVDADTARWIAQCWAAGDAAMRRLEPGQRPILWPEHFDVGILAGGVGFGVSPGDKYIGEPYAYVTPPTPRQDAFFAAPFGAARLIRELSDPEKVPAADAVLAFFAEGRRRATAP